MMTIICTFIFFGLLAYSLEQITGMNTTDYDEDDL